jgi:hypothetical protein
LLRDKQFENIDLPDTRTKGEKIGEEYLQIVNHL